MTGGYGENRFIGGSRLGLVDGLVSVLEAAVAGGVTRWVSLEATAIRKIYEMGVTSGTSASTFSPAEEVTRGQMAVCISRMLAHTHARPAGLTIQAAEPAISGDSDVTVSISYRDRTHQPLEARLVDVFRVYEPRRGFR